MDSLQVELAGSSLGNPLVAAAGTCGTLGEITDVLDPRWLGAITTKSITLEPREGHEPWRIVDVPSGMINAIGLANKGIDRFIEESLPEIDRIGTTVIGSIAGTSIEEYQALAARLQQDGRLGIIELNLSCPNHDSGLDYASDPAAAAELISAVRQSASDLKILAKLSPAIDDPVRMASVAIDAGVDGLTLVNTMPAMSICVNTRKPRVSYGRGGLSGPVIHQVAVRIVHDVHREVAGPAGIPIVGVGGVIDWVGAAEMILAGATCVGIGTGLFINPKLPRKIARGLDRWVRSHGCSNITELIGAAESAAGAS